MKSYEFTSEDWILSRVVSLVLGLRGYLDDADSKE